MSTTVYVRFFLIKMIVILCKKFLYKTPVYHAYNALFYCSIISIRHPTLCVFPIHACSLGMSVKRALRFISRTHTYLSCQTTSSKSKRNHVQIMLSASLLLKRNCYTVVVLSAQLRCSFPLLKE